jgi:hypothetical protein
MFYTLHQTSATKWDRSFDLKCSHKISSTRRHMLRPGTSGKGAAQSASMSYIRKIIWLTLCLLLPVAARSATINAASPSQTDVAVAINSASNGDTVQVPAGSATWNSALTIKKNISLIGAGSGQTIITPTGSSLVWAPTVDNLIRMSGFRFNCSGVTNPIMIIGKASKVRIDNCYFEKGDSPIVCNYMGSNATGRVAGVVDHCTFHNIERLFICDVRQTDGVWGATSWAEGVQPGSAAMLYFEDNQFIYDADLTNQSGSPDATFYGQYGGVCVIRHNTFSGYQYSYIDAHGDNPGYSTLYYEIYQNSFTAGGAGPVSGFFENQRGGKRIHWGNTFTGSFTPVELIKYWSTDVRVVSNTYFWGDTWNTGSSTDTNEADMVAVVNGNGVVSSDFIKLGQQYFLAAPKTGQIFYPYTPLVYPHPLVNAVPNQNSPAAPTSLRIVP